MNSDFPKLFPLPFLKLVFVWYEEEAFAHRENIPAVVSIMMLYGWAAIPLIYTVSFSFKTPGSACVKLVVMLTFLSISPTMLVTVTSDKGEIPIYALRMALISPLAARAATPTKMYVMFSATVGWGLPAGVC